MPEQEKLTKREHKWAPRFDTGHYCTGCGCVAFSALNRNDPCPARSPRGPQRLQAERDARDSALDSLEAVRKQLVSEAKAAADIIHARRGKVTSPDVIAYLRKNGWGDELDAVDRRFMGAVFRRGWRRIGYEPIGSHGRPVAVWAREGE